LFVLGLVVLEHSADARQYVEVISNKNSNRKGEILKSLFKKCPNDFHCATAQANKIRAGDPCGPVSLDGTDPVSDANAAANSLIGNAGVSVVPGTPVIGPSPSYALINTWQAGHAFSSVFPDGNARKRANFLKRVAS
jgi:hypothetical protein